MIIAIQNIQDFFALQMNVKIVELQEDSEAKEYSGYHFKLSDFHVKFRKAKITPTKIGQFVTLWKRNLETKQTEPYTFQDNFDFYIIYCEQNEKSGFFIFPKTILIKNKILTRLSAEGKRGFRVYPTWDKTENKQAVKTQNWQKHFFIDFAEENYLSKFESILKSEF